MDLNQKQLEILKIAEKLFAKNGFEGTSVRDIALAANINVAMINYYFESKENLLETIVKQGAEAYKLIPDTYIHEEDPLLRLERIIEHYISSNLANRYVYEILANENTIQKRIINSQIYTELRKHNIQLIKEVIEYGCEKGVFRYYDPILIHTTMIGTLMNFKRNRIIFEELLTLPPGCDFEEYLHETLTTHLKFTLKSILKNENQ